MRFRQPPEIAELGAAERLHPHPRRQRHLGEIGVVRAGIDRVVKALVDLVEAVADRRHSSARAIPREWPPAGGARSAVIRSAAKPAQIASSSAIASNMPVSRSIEGRATTAPRCARASTRPEATSWRIASRTGVRDTLKRRAMSVSSSAAPGGSAPRTISSASCRRSSSARVILSGWGEARSTRRTTVSASAAGRAECRSEDRRDSCLLIPRFDR